MIRRFSVSLWLSLCTPILLAQGDRGSIAGLVSEPSGGVIPGVTIEAVNQATNLKADTVTTATGIYRLVALPIGSTRRPALRRRSRSGSEGCRR